MGGEGEEELVCQIQYSGVIYTATNAIIYQRYPWSNNWEDITDNLRIEEADIEERVNGAGICNLTISNIDRWAERTIRPGFMYRVILKTPSGHTFPRYDFEGIIPPDFITSRIGIESDVCLPIVGYYDMFSRTQNIRNLNGANIISAMALLNAQVTRGSGVEYMKFAGEVRGVDNVRVPVDMNMDANCKTLMENIRTLIYDETDSIYPRFYHLMTVQLQNQPSLILRREPDIHGTPDIIIEPDYVIDVSREDTNNLITSVIIGNKVNWDLRYQNQNFIDKFGRFEIRSEDNEDDGGLKSSYLKTRKLVRNQFIPSSNKVKLAGHWQIPLLSLVEFNSDEPGLAKNSIVYGRRINRSGSTTTELLLRNLPDETL